MKSRSKSGFTLVEILIVVVILGILAAIVIPQFSQASSEARASSVKSNLQMVRSQIELYKIQHNDELPTAGGLDLITALTSETTVAGVVGTGYGPYMQKFPTNAILELGDVIAEVVIDTTVGGGTPVASEVDGWFYNTDNGNFAALNATALVVGEEW